MKRNSQLIELTLTLLFFLGASLSFAQESPPELPALDGIPSRSAEPLAIDEGTFEPPSRNTNHTPITKEQRDALFMVGAPEVGFATAFAIDRDQRLLVTNAHVADNYLKHGKLYAILNGTTSIYKVNRVWYHPGVKRQIGNFRSQVARSENPADGWVEVASPDLAILQLSDEGHPLPSAVSIALPSEVTDLFAKRVSMIGFPGHSNTWPELGVSPQATFETGVINRATNFGEDRTLGLDKRQRVQHSIRSSPGGSGSPIFDEHGHVVAVHNSYRPTEDSPIYFGIRADAIWEALAFYGLLPEQTQQIENGVLALDRFKEEDPNLEAYRFVARKYAEAQQLSRAGSYAKASEAARVILEKHPGNPLGNYATGMVYMESSNQLRGQLSTEKIYSQYEYALKHIRYFLDVVPQSIPGQIAELRILTNMTMLDHAEGRTAAAQQFSYKLLPHLSRMISVSSLSDDEYVRMYHARARIRQIVGDVKGGTADLDEAVQLFPNNPLAYYFRASWNERVLKRVDLAQLDRNQMRALTEANRVG